MEAVNSQLVCGLLSGLDDLPFHLLARLGDDLLDPARVDSAVRYELLESQPGDLAPNRVKARNNHRVRGVVDNHVNTGRSLEGADIPPLTTYDTSLHFIVGQRHG